MMTARDFNKLAAILAGDLATARSAGKRDVVTALTNVTLSIADMCAQSNPAFDRQRFYAAAGIVIE